MEDIKHIQNPDNVYIDRKELYSGIFLYSLPMGYEFWSNNCNFGNTIYAREVPDNYYIIKKKNNEINSSKNSE